MKSAHLVPTAVFAALQCLQAPSSGQSKIDFARDVQPLLRAHCLECHGPEEPKNGFRLDRREAAMRGGTSPMIAPGNSQASRLYLKLIGDQEGPQMPPDGTMSKEEIDVIKTWIDQGATWPEDAAAGKATAADPRVIRLMDALRDGDMPAVRQLLQADPGAANLKGSGGATPLMYAALYGDVDSIRLLLDAGADPKIRNDAGATAVHWSVDDLEKTRLLLNAGAEVNARSDDGRTPLLSATGRVGSAEVVKLLLDRGANPSAMAHSYRGPTTPLRQAADVGDALVVKLLLDHGAELQGPAQLAVLSAFNANSVDCVDQLTPHADPKMMSQALLFLVPPRGTPAGFGNTALMKQVIALGADVNAKDWEGRTPLMLAAGSEYFSPDTIQLLIDRGAEVNAKNVNGETALDFAQRSGQAAVVDLLVKAGAKTGGIAGDGPTQQRQRAASPRAAVERSLPLLQRSAAIFAERSGCVSCHNNSLTSLTIAAARDHNFQLDEALERAQLDATAAFVESWRERSLQAWPIPGDAATVSYLLVGLDAGRHAPDLATDAWARYLKNRQATDGHWADLSHRPPLEASAFQATATALRALQAYSPQARKAEYEVAIRRGAEWLKSGKPKTTEDRAFQLLGLKWSGAGEGAVRAAARSLISEQRPDGGWAQHLSMASDAYATGQALVALHESGAVSVADATYKRGLAYLMSTQLADGSWHVRTRSIAFQPYFESGFPHGHDQWISVAATNWAAMALMPAAMQ